MEDDKLGRIEEKIDKLGTRIGNIDVTLAAQHVSLKEHMRRTSNLEARVEPLERRRFMVDGVLKLLGILAVVAGAAEGFVAVMEYVSKH